MLKKLHCWWNNASMFRKTYLMAILFVGGIVCTGEGLEGMLDALLGGENGLSGTDEIAVWIAATFIPTAFGAYGLTRCFLRPLERVSQAITGLSKGELHTRITSGDILRGDELGVLARLINHMAERLEHVFENERNLLAAISHELRSPLTRLSLCVELLRRKDRISDAEIHLQRLELETGRMNDLISQLLDYARREMTPQSRERVDLRALVQDVAMDATFEGKERGIQLEISLPDRAELCGNSLLLRQAVDNVMRNALSYTPPDSKVIVSLASTAEGYRLTVLDNGPGVPEAMLKDIFTPFFRVNADRDRVSGGMGMGLCLVEQAVRLHKGTVFAENAFVMAGVKDMEDTEGTKSSGLRVVITLPANNHGEQHDWPYSHCELPPVARRLCSA